MYFVKDSINRSIIHSTAHKRLLKSCHLAAFYPNIVQFLLVTTSIFWQELGVSMEHVIVPSKTSCYFCNRLLLNFDQYLILSLNPLQESHSLAKNQFKASNL